MYQKYLEQLEEAGKIRNLKERSIACYKNYTTVLTVAEIDRLLDAAEDIKYKAMFATMYSSGMRVSEVIHLHYGDISRTNMQIHIRDTKNRMDRYTILSKRNLEILTRYWYEKGKPRGILFPNKFTGNYLTVSTLEQVMRRAVPKEMWMDARREDVLDAPYFHLVFTLLDILNPVIYSNQKRLYDTLYHAAFATISELAADSKYLGASVGYICILHTWGSEMNLHLHIHTILLGGGLTSQNKWNDFFFPIQVISKVFRGKYMEELKNLWKNDLLEFRGTAKKYRNHYVFKELMDTCYGTNWAPYCKKTFHGAQSVIDYLGKYTHRIAISNHRIFHMDEEKVTFSMKDYKNQSQWKELTLSGVDFIRRFLMHVPPKRFVRIRHYGLLCSRTKNKKLTLCRNLLGCKKYLSKRSRDG